MPETTYLVKDSTFSGIADAVRDLRGETGTMTPAQIEEKIRAAKIGLPVQVTALDGEAEWVRPNGWGNLDALTLSDNELYMTIDNSGRIDDPHLSVTISTTNSSAFTLEIGSIVENTFVATETQTVNSDANFIKWFDNSYPNYPVVHIVSTENITSFSFATASANDKTYDERYNAVVERVGKIYSFGSGIWGTYWIERDKTKVVKVTSLLYAWYNCFRLQSLDLSDWNTSEWSGVTSLGYTWYCCYSLRSLDLSNWDVSSLAIKNIGAAWYSCYSLHTLNLSGWDTSNWAITTLDSTWTNCYSLKALDISNWNTTGWVVSNLASTWSNCYSLKSLDLSKWDTSNWKVTSLNSTWNYCFSLQSLDIFDWNTSGWAVTSFSSTWYGCFSLLRLDLSKWNTSNWKVTSLANTWNNCYSLCTLEVSKWDTSGWTVTSLGNTWVSCYSLQSLDVSGWNTSNWAVVSLNGTWNNCSSLKSLDLSSWDTSGWNVTSFSATWNNCYSLKSLNLSGWVTTGWTAADWSRVTYNAHSLKSLDVSIFDMSIITNWGSSSYNATTLGRNLVHFTAGVNNSGKFKPTAYKTFNISACNGLSKQALLNIIDMLASDVSGYTLKVGTVNLNKLTTAEKALVTAKGWSIVA